MKIGIDLDNTIISYDIAFQVAAFDRGLIREDCEHTKQEISREIKSRENGEIEWQRLQGYVYGKGIGAAHIFPGVYRFLWRCYSRGIDVEIVSHKTEYGHFDPERYSLRKSAICFLQEQKILHKDNKVDNKQLISNITFTSTQEEKTSYIAGGNFDYFIDDLEEIVESKNLTYINTILFNGSDGYSWDEINSTILGDWTEKESHLAIKKILPKKNILSIEQIEGRGNSKIVKISADNKMYISKIYPQSGEHNRIHAEYGSLKLLKELSIPNLQTPVACDNDLGIAIYDYIDGEKISSHSSDDINQMLSLLAALNSTEIRNRFSNFNFASNACISGVDIEVQIEDRLKRFVSAADSNKELSHFIYNEFAPAYSSILNWSKKIWANSYKENLELSELVLSPSDFGFHNAIKDSSGKLFFYDFEYFGWDDPVKLMSDVSHHAAFNLSSENEKLWLNGCLDIYGDSILDRYRAAWPLYGLIWCLIILNEYNNIFWNRRIAANSTLKEEKELVLHVQLNKAKKQLNKVLDRYRDNEI